jgi:hypothetical protein
MDRRRVTGTKGDVAPDRGIDPGPGLTLGLGMGVGLALATGVARGSPCAGETEGEFINSVKGRLCGEQSRRTSNNAVHRAGAARDAQGRGGGEAEGYTALEQQR